MDNKVSNRLGERGTVRFLAMGAGIAALLATGCGTATSPPEGSPTARPSPVPTVSSPASTATATATPSSFQALVEYAFPDTAAASGTTLRLYSSDTGVASLILTFAPDSGGSQFAPNDRIYFTSGLSELESSDRSGGTRQAVLNLDPNSTGGGGWVGAHDWSQNGTLAYLALKGVGGTSHLVIRPAVGTPVTLSLPAVLGGRGLGSVLAGRQ